MLGIAHLIVRVLLKSAPWGRCWGGLPAFLHPHYQACSRSGQVRGGTRFLPSPRPLGQLSFILNAIEEGQGQLTHTHAIVASFPALPQRGTGLPLPHQSCSASSPTTTPLGPSLSCCPCRGRTGSPAFMQCVPTLQAHIISAITTVWWLIGGGASSGLPLDINMASGCSTDPRHPHNLRWKCGPLTSMQT